MKTHDGYQSDSWTGRPVRPNMKHIGLNPFAPSSTILEQLASPILFISNPPSISPKNGMAVPGRPGASSPSPASGWSFDLVSSDERAA